MAYLRVEEARAALRGRYPTASPTIEFATRLIREGNARVREKSFDVFLSHSTSDAVLIASIKEYLETQGLSVYVDWLEDPHLDRSRVDAATAGLLRERMKSSAMLYYAATSSSADSKWMPWELGYFDGLKSGRVAILPLVQARDSEFQGVEYLGLYPKLEVLPTTDGPRQLFVTKGAGSNTYMPLSSFRAGAREYRTY